MYIHVHYNINLFMSMYKCNMSTPIARYTYTYQHGVLYLMLTAHVSPMW